MPNERKLMLFDSHLMSELPYLLRAVTPHEELFRTLRNPVFQNNLFIKSGHMPGEGPWPQVRNQIATCDWFCL
jgi:hypothetical protein